MKYVFATFEKTGTLRYISHLDLQRAFTRLLLRSKLPIRFSDFRRAVMTLLGNAPAAVSDSVPAVPRHTAIRIERGAAVSGSVRVPLTPCEERILTALTNAYPHAASAAELERSFTRHGSNSVRVYITYLRKKLTALPAYRAILPEKNGGFSLVLHDGAQITDNTDKG